MCIKSVLMVLCVLVLVSGLGDGLVRCFRKFVNIGLIYVVCDGYRRGGLIIFWLIG